MKADTPYDPKLLGIISTNPGVIMGSVDGDSGKADSRQLALAGRVPVKIAPDSPPIEVGDFLTSSSTYPGMAMRATHAGYAVAQALESWQPCDNKTTQQCNNVSLIDAFVEPAYYVGALDADGNLEILTVGTLRVNNLIEGNSAIRGRVLLATGESSVRVVRNWPSAPVSVVATPSFDTTVFVTDVTVSGFTLRMGTPPTKPQTLYWQVMW